MSNVVVGASEHDRIAEVVRIYVDGARSGRGADMRPAFLSEATIVGYLGQDLLAGPIQRLYDWNDENGPATGLQARVVSIDVVETVATVRLELDDWTGLRFTDLFTLVKRGGKWKIAAKVFHLHDTEEHQTVPT